MKAEVAKGLLDIKAVFLRPNEPFTWASGIKSPIYCDNRLILTAPKVRDVVENGLIKVLDDNFPEAEVLMGTSTAGIPHAAIMAHIKGLPFGYVRSSNKDHGRGNKIEGSLLPGQKVVVIEDLISTSKSVEAVIEALKDNGADVIGIVSIFTYQMSTPSVKNVSLCDLDTLLEVALNEEYITEEEYKRIKRFRDNPKDESWIG